MTSAKIQRVRTGTLDVAYAESGPPDVVAVILMHGCPYDPRAYVRMADA
jgi:hypothetical protein